LHNPKQIYSHWTEDEIKYLEKNYSEMGANDISKHINKTHIQVRNKANTLHLVLNKKAAHRIVHSKAKEYMLAHNPMKNQESVNKVKEWRKNNPDKVLFMVENITKGQQKFQKINPSSLEIKARKMLDELKVNYEPSFLIKPKFVVDIRIENIIIQLDGDYWHGHPRFVNLTERQKKQQMRDKAQDKCLTSLGYKVIRIWESDLSSEKLISVLDENDIVHSSALDMI
jgi:G:T-mismatch repair DNA endonuclease (very short patch repair protein)